MSHVEDNRAEEHGSAVQASDPGGSSGDQISDSDPDASGSPAKLPLVDATMASSGKRPRLQDLTLVVPGASSALGSSDDDSLTERESARGRYRLPTVERE